MNRHALASKDCVADRLLDLQIERVAPLVLAGLKVTLVTNTAVINLVLAKLIPVKLFEQLSESVLAEFAHSLWSEFSTALFVLNESRLGELTSNFSHPGNALGGLLTEQVANPFNVCRGQRTRVRSAAHELLKLVKVTELTHKFASRTHI